jgi:hypothetical protein
MMRSTEYVLVATSVALFIIGGTILPGVLAAGRDKIILGQVQSVPLDAAELSDYVNISMVDKADLMGQASGTATYVPLVTGAGYGRDSIRTKFHEELDKLHDMRFYPIPADDEWRSFRSGVTLYILNDAPAISMIVWEISVRADNLSGTFYMDDQTGKIMSFSFSGDGYDTLAYTEDMVRSWGAYLGVDVRNVKKGQGLEEVSGVQETVYLFDLYSGLRGAGSRMSSYTQSDPSKTNRWSLSYDR